MVPPTFCVSLKSAKEKKEPISRDNSEFVIYFLPKMTSKVNLSQFQEVKKNLSVSSQSISLVTFHLSSKPFFLSFLSSALPLEEQSPINQKLLRRNVTIMNAINVYVTQKGI